MFSTVNTTRLQSATLRALGAFIVTTGALWLSGCATPAANPPEVVRQLVNQRWQYVMAGQFDKAYAMTAPSYRKLKTLDIYQRNLIAAPVKWLSAEVVRIDCETQTCKVRIKAVRQILMPTRYKGLLDSGLDETWVFEDGQWWMFETL